LCLAAFFILSLLVADSLFRQPEEFVNNFNFVAQVLPARIVARIQGLEVERLMGICDEIHLAAMPTTAQRLLGNACCLPRTARRNSSMAILIIAKAMVSHRLHRHSASRVLRHRAKTLNSIASPRGDFLGEGKSAARFPFLDNFDA
jgi:type II secretory pathway component PulK